MIDCVSNVLLSCAAWQGQASPLSQGHLYWIIIFALLAGLIRAYVGERLPQANFRLNLKVVTSTQNGDGEFAHTSSCLYGNRQSGAGEEKLGDVSSIK